MFSPIEVTFQPSRWLGRLSIISHLSLVVLVCSTALQPTLKAALVSFALASFVIGRMRQRHALRALRWDADHGILKLERPGNGWIQADGVDSVTVFSLLLIFRFRVDGRKVLLVLAPDSVSPDGFRRLSVLGRLAPMSLNGPDRATRS